MKEVAALTVIAAGWPVALVFTPVGPIMWAVATAAVLAWWAGRSTGRAS